jgi:hypothetical protein
MGMAMVDTKGFDPIREAEFWSFVWRAWHGTAHLGQLDAILHWLGRRYRYQARVLGKAYIVLRHWKIYS